MTSMTYDITTLVIQYYTINEKTIHILNMRAFG